MLSGGGSYRRSVITGPRQIAFEEVAIPLPGPSQVLVKVAAAAAHTPTGFTWTQANPDPAPPIRLLASMAYSPDAGASILFGTYRAAKMSGWIKPSERQKSAAEKRQKMEHYFYHCERNPEAFMRLKVENLQRETIEENIAEAREIEKQ